MSGNRHHFIPQFLQKKFICTERKKGSITHVYRKNGSHFSANVVNTSVENKFYTSETLDADENITKEENKILSILRKEEPDSAEMAIVIAHFEIRTKNLRVMFASTIDSLLKSAYKKILNDQYLKELIKKLFQNNPNIIDNEFNKIQGRNQIPKQLEKKLIKEVKLGKSKSIELFVESYIKVAQDKFSNYSLEIEKSIKNGHIKILQDSFSLKKRTARYKRLTYTLHHIEDSSMILGDSVVVFKVHSKGEVTWKQFTDRDDEILCIAIPIASNKIIIGLNEDTVKYKPDIPEIKLALSKCSLEQFISSKKTNENIELAKHIGTMSPPLTQKEIDTIVIEGFENAVLKRE